VRFSAATKNFVAKYAKVAVDTLKYTAKRDVQLEKLVALTPLEP
jgi:hypothetical protein